MRIGDVIDGRYRLERQIGEGGMAVVWLARDERLERPVAVKLLLGGNTREQAAMGEQFLREAKLAASVRHRHVVQILDFGKHENALPFMVMEALDGESMADRFSRRAQFQLREVADIALACLQGLAAVHAAGIVHRDIKPENIFLVNDPAGAYPKLLDFGISRAARKDVGLRSAITTEDGMMLGTPEYMSPEQARGLTDVDARTDLYSLGVVMYEALTGRVPYESEHSGDLLVMIMAGQAPPVVELSPAVGPALSQVVAVAMAREREQRFPSALAMHEALRAASQSLPALALPTVTRGHAGGDPHASLAHALEQVRAEGPTVRIQSGGNRLAMMGFAGVLLLAGVVIFVGLRIRSQAEPQYIVVQSTGSEPPRTTAPAQPPAATPPTAVPAGTVGPAGGSSAPQAATNPPQPSAARPTKPRATPNRTLPAGAEDPSQAVARAFVQQKARVARCLSDHADVVPTTTDLDVRIALEANGKVREVQITPDAIASSPAGPCIVAAVQAMTFDAQPAPLAVHVPISARRK
jgi:serine/threonine-protein kinase